MVNYSIVRDQGCDTVHGDASLQDHDGPFRIFVSEANQVPHGSKPLQQECQPFWMSRNALTIAGSGAPALAMACGEVIKISMSV